MSYQVKIEQFEGPLDLLLRLIESRELDISQVSIAKVADQFIAYLNSVEEKRPEELVDFLAVAAKLMLIKSKELLPHLDFEGVDEDATELEEQLRRYQQFVKAAENIQSNWKKSDRLVSRSRLLVEHRKAFYPPQGISTEKLKQAFEKFISKLKKEAKEVQQTVKRAISIKEKISHIRSTLFNKLRVGFKGLIGSSKNKTEVVVTFLALLELVKQKTINVEQGSQFGDIHIKTREENKQLVGVNHD